MRALTKILKAMRGEKAKKKHKTLMKLAPIVLTKSQSESIGQRLTAAMHPENPESETTSVRRRLLAHAHSR